MCDIHSHMAVNVCRAAIFWKYSLFITLGRATDDVRESLSNKKAAFSLTSLKQVCPTTDKSRYGQNKSYIRHCSGSFWHLMSEYVLMCSFKIFCISYVMIIVYFNIVSKNIFLLYRKNIFYFIFHIFTISSLTYFLLHLPHLFYFIFNIFFTSFLTSFLFHLPYVFYFIFNIFSTFS